jgi:hypothetical protein
MICRYVQGVCHRQIHDTIQRWWDIIENITVDKLGQYPYSGFFSDLVYPPFLYNAVTQYVN